MVSKPTSETEFVGKIGNALKPIDEEMSFAICPNPDIYISDEELRALAAKEYPYFSAATGNEDSHYSRNEVVDERRDAWIAASKIYLKRIKALEAKVLELETEKHQL